MKMPCKNDFPEGSKFHIYEFNVPLVQVPNSRSPEWYNWFGGKPRSWAVEGLKPGNNWEAESFEQWQKIVKESL